ncbi:MAG: alpha-amylase family glycosyl hydrolase, partial [Fimbriimonadales bacterium]
MTALLLAAALIGSLQGVRHEFRYESMQPVASVSVAGTFNGWSPSANPMVPDERRRIWRLVLELPAGRHAYKFVVDGSRWVVDPANPRSEDDGAGNVNSILTVLPPEYRTPARVGDGRITASGVSHRPAAGDAVWDRGRLFLTVRTRPGDVRAVRFVPDVGPAVPLSRGESDAFQSVWKGLVRWDAGRPLRYRILLEDGSAWWLGRRGLGSERRTEPFVLRPEQAAPLAPPRWVERTVFYQIFPDRFANGDPSNDPPSVEPWDARPKWYTFLGGDLAGVLRRSGYLAELGVGAVYLNPVFVSPSAHGYETTDYLRIEPRFGDNDLFVRLTRELRSKGIRAVLDGVFNHTSSDSIYFDRYGRYSQVGACESPSSPYRDWYFFTDVTPGTGVCA